MGAKHYLTLTFSPTHTHTHILMFLLDPTVVNSKEPESLLLLLKK